MGSLSFEISLWPQRILPKTSHFQGWDSLFCILGFILEEPLLVAIAVLCLLGSPLSSSPGSMGSQPAVISAAEAEIMIDHHLICAHPSACTCIVVGLGCRIAGAPVTPPKFQLSSSMFLLYNKNFLLVTASSSCP